MCLPPLERSRAAPRRLERWVGLALEQHREVNATASPAAELGVAMGVRRSSGGRGWRWEESSGHGGGVLVQREGCEREQQGEMEGRGAATW